MTRLAIVADDLTGAADAGGCFAARGFATAIHLSGPAPETGVVVRSTESRHLPEHQAIVAVERATRALLASPSDQLPLLLKKIDSALRGNPVGETLALARVAGARRVLVAPALPAQDRSTVGGAVLVRGLPVNLAGFDVPSAYLTDLFRDAGAPVDHIPLGEVQAGVRAIERHLAAAEGDFIIGDAETDRDLETLAASCLALGIGCFAGSAGLARAIARKLPAPAPRLVPAPRPGGPVLVLAGSRHPATVAQIDFARMMGVSCFAPEPDELRTGRALTTATKTQERLAWRRHVIITPPDEHIAQTELLLAFFADLVRSVLEDGSLGGLVLTGGDVAAAVCARLDVERIELQGEAEPAIPWGRVAGGPAHGLNLITKAGSFGGPATLGLLIAFLTTPTPAVARTS